MSPVVRSFLDHLYSNNDEHVHSLFARSWPTTTLNNNNEDISFFFVVFNTQDFFHLRRQPQQPPTSHFDLLGALSSLPPAMPAPMTPNKSLQLVGGSLSP